MVILASEVSRYKTLLNKNSAREAILCQLDSPSKCLGVADVKTRYRNHANESQTTQQYPAKGRRRWRESRSYRSFFYSIIKWHTLDIPTDPMPMAKVIRDASIK